jgi:intracellular septation protein
MDTSDAWSRVNKRKLLERFAIEMGPALVFVAGLQLVSLTAATVAFVLATLVAATYSWVEKRRFPIVPFAMVALGAVFGALTVVSGEAAFIEFRATVVNGGGALAILAGLATGRLLLKTTLQDGFRLPDAAWRVLSYRMALYLALMAAANEVVWRGFSTETWAWFKAASPVLNLLFLALNWPFIRDRLRAEPGAELTDEPPAGPVTTLDPTVRRADVRAGCRRAEPSP